MSVFDKYKWLDLPINTVLSRVLNPAATRKIEQEISTLIVGSSNFDIVPEQQDIDMDLGYLKPPEQVLVA